MKRPPGPFGPLAQLGRAETVELFTCASFAQRCPVKRPERGYRDVPDRPAEIHLESFVTAVDGQDDRETGHGAGEAGVHRFDRESAVVAQRYLGGTRGHFPTLAARDDERAAPEFGPTRRIGI
jgi:hypothetical protein